MRQSVLLSGVVVAGIIGVIAGTWFERTRAASSTATIAWRMQTATDRDDRIAAVGELSRRKDRNALLPLIATATMDLEAQVRKAAAVALGGYRSADAVPALVALLYDESIEVRTTAAMALGSLGRCSIEELRPVYLSGHPVACLFAAISLSRIDDRRVEQIFAEGAKSDSPEVRKWAEQLGGQPEADLAVKTVLAQ